jgi:hypothetical protein
VGLFSFLRSEPAPVRDAADQLRLVMNAPFSRKRLMSKAELGVFRTIEEHLKCCGPGYRLMAQPSLGEFVESPDPAAHRAVNSRRVDMLVIDTFAVPVIAIEHQGAGHYQADAAARDAIKREALRRAGIELVEIFDYHREDDIRRLVSDAIARNRPAAHPAAPPPRAAGR